MKDLWYRCWHGLAARIYFDRIAVRFPERLPEDGPCLYVALHRNGAVDGFVYRQAVPRAVFLISSQLRRSFLARCFFCGIAVTRRGDAGDRSENAAALRDCVQLLADGGGLVVFPEGTMRRDVGEDGRRFRRRQTKSAGERSSGLSHWAGDGPAVAAAFVAGGEDDVDFVAGGGAGG